jgi:hypothetical protein
MKKCVFIWLLCLGMLCGNAFGQTAGDFVTNGLTDLANQDLIDANTSFQEALALSPTNEDANVLVAATRLLLLPNTAAGNNYLTSLGFPTTGRNIYDWTSFPATNSYGGPVFPANYNFTNAVFFFRTNVMPLINASLTNLADMTDTNFQLSVNFGVGGTVALDYGDVQMLRTLLTAAEFAGYTLNANNAGVIIPQVETWAETNGFTLQLLLSTYTSLGVMENTGDLAASKSAGTNAIELYFGASDFIRNDRQPDSDDLFSISPDETNQEAEFRTGLSNVLLSLSAPTEFVPSNYLSTVYTAPYFSGTNSLRKLVPQFSGDTYVNNTVPDYTFDDVLPYLPAFKTEGFLRKTLGSRAGIYMGTIQDDYYGDSGAGSFGVLYNTDGQITIVGFDFDIINSPFNNQDGGFLVQVTANAKGEWQISNSSVTGSGNVGRNGSFNGSLNFGGDTIEFINSYEISPPGQFTSSAGYYTGSPSGGSVSAVLGADGEFVFRVLENNGTSDGGYAQFGPDNTLTTFSAGGTQIIATNYPSRSQIIGTYSGGNTFTLTLNTKFPYDDAPVITANLPLNATVALSTNSTFTLGATSVPLCYQWYLNGNPLPGYTSNVLVVSNNLWTTTGTYQISATVANCAGETNSQVCTVNVLPETTAPGITITSPTPGQLWSNSTFTVTGTANDKVEVTNVYYSLNNGPYLPVTPGTPGNWTNWSANVNLIPGTNTISAYAVNIADIDSTNFNVKVVYIVSAPLTVQIIGDGTINPDYSNAVLQIGNNYFMTATAKDGFMFTNWTGGIGDEPLTLYTNGPTVQFTMENDLVMQANFVDTNKPYVSITNVTSGMLVSNAAFTVMGVTTDNVAVANVYFSLDGSPYGPVIPIANLWSTNIMLTPGTNLLSAYAVDTSGNISTTDNVSLVYVVSASLGVKVSGLGTINPDYSNAVLAVGKNYTVTATAASGFMFTNWVVSTNFIGGVVSNSSALVFSMAPNLTLQANFAETAKPTVTVTNLTSGQQVSNATFVVQGTASDAWLVSNVWYQVNGTGWNLATNLNNGTNWAAGTTLTPGTNVFQVYAVNLGGQLSTTDAVSFQYIVSASLGVEISGLGTINPDDSNAVLAIGQKYSVSASPANGFMFTNWMVSTNFIGGVVSNSSTLVFTMATNLTLQANFAETAKPTVTVTNLTSGQQVSNAMFVVQGKASDDWLVSNVWYQVNGTGWNLATNLNNGTNWAAGTTLTPGTNVFQVYAVNLGGQLSTTDTVSFQYVVSASLGVKISGLGTINPDDSNAVLAIGQKYSVSASPANGFMFTNWMVSTNFIGGVVSNSSTLVFTMATNLTLQANFAETATPTVNVTNLTSGQQVSNAMFTVKGTASDDWLISNVWYQVDGTGWNLATNLNNGTNWAAATILTPGTNVFQVYAVNLGGLLSATDTVNFQYLVTNMLVVEAEGLGTLSPDYSNAWLNLGENYRMSATAANGFMFTNWVVSTNFIGGVKTNNATVQFMMASNLTLQVNFVETAKPTLTISSPASGTHTTNALPTVMGTASDDWKVAQVSYQLNGGAWSLVSTTNSYTNWTSTVELAAGTNTFSAYALNLGGNYTTNSISLISTNAFKLQLTLAAQPLTANGLNLSLQISPGLNGHIQGSTNFTTWITLTNFVGTNSTITIHDSGATNLDHRFYRAVVP